MTSKRKEHCSHFPASILHPRVSPHVCHSWSLSRHPIHSEEQKWQGESRVIFFFLWKKKKKKHLWARAQLSRRAKALCTFPSTLTVSLPVCGLDVGIGRGAFVDVGAGSCRCNVRFVCFLGFVLKGGGCPYFYCFYIFVLPFLFCMDVSLFFLYDICKL